MAQHVNQDLKFVPQILSRSGDFADRVTDAVVLHFEGLTYALYSVFYAGIFGASLVRK